MVPKAIWDGVKGNYPTPEAHRLNPISIPKYILNWHYIDVGLYVLKDFRTRHDFSQFLLALYWKVK